MNAKPKAIKQFVGATIADSDGSYVGFWQGFWVKVTIGKIDFELDMEKSIGGVPCVVHVKGGKVTVEV